MRIIRSSASLTYIAALVMVMIMGIMLSQAAVVWKTPMQREREAELIFRGTQIRDAMRRWYKLTPGPDGFIARPGMSGVSPTAITAGSPSLNELKDLLLDPRSASKVRYP